MKDIERVDFAWIYPDNVRGQYWQPVVENFRKIHKNAIFFTGNTWSSFNPSETKNRGFRVIGKCKYYRLKKAKNGYFIGFYFASPKIIFPLLKFRPKVIFASAFSMWTLLALILKGLTKSKVAIMYDGCSPNTSFENSSFRTITRKIMSILSDAFIPNSKAAEIYFKDNLGVPERKIFPVKYLVPDVRSLKQPTLRPFSKNRRKLVEPVFLYVGQLIERKGLGILIESCADLIRSDCNHFSLMIVGDGPQKDKLMQLSIQSGVAEHLHWTGWVDYGNLGRYFEDSDIFVFPTFEDSWGMVVVEAMAFGLPVICSRGANVSELIDESVNGFLFDPGDRKALTSAMRKLIDHTDLQDKMGRKTIQSISDLTPQAAAKGFAKVVWHFFPQAYSSHI